MMAAYLRGMNNMECKVLTCQLCQSGERFAWPDVWKNLVVGVLSIWEVGSKTRLLLAPTLAACGLKVDIVTLLCSNLEII